VAKQASAPAHAIINSAHHAHCRGTPRRDAQSCRGASAKRTRIFALAHRQRAHENNAHQIYWKRPHAPPYNTVPPHCISASSAALSITCARTGDTRGNLRVMKAGRACVPYAFHSYSRARRGSRRQARVNILRFCLIERSASFRLLLAPYRSRWSAQRVNIGNITLRVTQANLAFYRHSFARMEIHKSRHARGCLARCGISGDYLMRTRLPPLLAFTLHRVRAAGVYISARSLQRTHCGARGACSGRCLCTCCRQAHAAHHRTRAVHCLCATPSRAVETRPRRGLERLPASAVQSASFISARTPPHARWHISLRRNASAIFTH